MPRRRLVQSIGHSRIGSWGLDRRIGQKTSGHGFHSINFFRAVSSGVLDHGRAGEFRSPSLRTSGKRASDRHRRPSDHRSTFFNRRVPLSFRDVGIGFYAHGAGIEPVRGCAHFPRGILGMVDRGRDNRADFIGIRGAQGRVMRRGGF